MKTTILPKLFRSSVSRFRFRMVAYSAALSLLLVGGQSALAGTTWDGGGADGLWLSGTNWNPDGAPTSGTGTFLTFAGTTRLSNTNNFTNATFGSLTFASGAGAFVLSGSSITLGGSASTAGITVSSTSVQTISFDMALGGTNNQSISVVSGGKLVLGGALSRATAPSSGNALLVSGGGTLSLTGTWNSTNVSLSATNNSVIEINSAGITGRRLGLTSGTISVLSGTHNFSASTSSFGETNGSFTTTYNQTAGSMTLGTLTIANGTGASTVVNISGGALIATTIQTSRGVASGTGGVVNVSGNGLVNVGTFNFGDGGTGSSGANNTITVSGTGAEFRATTAFNWGNNSTEVRNNTVNIDAGKFSTVATTVTNGTSNAVLNFSNGGVLEARSSSTNFLNGLDTINIKGGGGVINTNGNGITITQNLLSGTNSGTDSLTKTGSGVLTLSGSNNYAGGTTVNTGGLSFANLNAKPSAGTHAFGAGTILGLGVSGSAGFFTTSDIDNAFAGTMTGNLSNVTVTATTDVGIDTGAGDLVYGSSVPGVARGLAKLGANTLTLTGTSAYTGPTTIVAGTLSISSDLNISGTASALVFDGGTLQVTGTSLTSLNTARTTTFNSGKTVAFDIADPTNSFTVSQAINPGTGGIAKSGSGTLIVSGSNTYTGTTTVNAGTLKVGSSDAFTNKGPLTLVNASGAAFDLNGFNASFTNLTTGTTGNTITTTGAGSGTDTLTISALTASSGALFTDNGTRKLAVTISGGNGFDPLTNTANTFSGGLTLGAQMRIIAASNSVAAGGKFGKGTITIGTQAQLYFNTASNITIDNPFIMNDAQGNGTRAGSVRIQGGTNNVLAGQITANNAAATFGADGAASFALTGKLTGTNGFTFNQSSGTNPWTMTLNNAAANNDYAGATTIGSAQTTLKLGAADQIPNGTGKGNVSVTGTFDLNGYNETINGLSGAGTVDNVVATGSSSNTLTLGDGDATASFTGRILNTSGTLGVTKIGTGTQTLSGSNTYTGPTSINGGILKAANANVLATTGTITVTNAGSTLAVNYGGASDFTEAQVVTLLAKTSFASSATAFGFDTTNASGTYNAVLSMPAGLTKLGSNTLTLTATNTYTGATTISAGTLSISTDDNIAGTASALIFDGGTLQVTGTSLTSLNPGRTTTFNTGKAVGFDIADPTNNFTVGQAINSGTGALTKSGSGVLTLTNSNSFTGNTTINGGKIILANADAIGAAGQKVRINTGGALEYATNAPANSYILDMGSNNSGTIILNRATGGAGFSQPVGNSTLGNSTLNLEAGANVTSGTANLAFSGIILAAGTSGALSLNPNTATILVSGSIYSATNFAKTLGLGGTTAGNEISGEIANVTNTVSVLKSGSSSWTLSGPNTYTGTTVVREGTLTLSGPRTGSSGAITVADTAGTNAILNIQNGTFALGGNQFLVSSATNTGTVNQAGGDISFTGGNQVLVGNNGTGVYNMSGGTITTAASTTRGVSLGLNNGAVGGTFNLSGSGAINAANATLQIGRFDSDADNTTNLFNQTGGTATFSRLGMGGDGGSSGAETSGGTHTLTITGGIFTANIFNNLAGSGSNVAVINIGGSADVTLPAFPTARGIDATATIYFDGGTLRPAAGSASYMGGLTNAFIKAGGLNLDLGSNDITISQNLLTDGSSAGGGLTKAGSGKLTLAGQSTYTGATTLNNGTLTLTGSASINSSSSIAVNFSATKLVQNSSVAVTSPIAINEGTLTGSGTVGSVTVSDSSFSFVSNNDGAAGASLTVGSLTFSGAATVNLFSNSPTAPLITGTLASNAAGTVTINANAAAWLNATTYDLISYTGTIGGGGFGQFALGTVTGLSSRQSFTFGNSGTAITLAISGADVIWTGAQSNAWTTTVVGGSSNWVLSGTAPGPTDFQYADNVVFTGTASSYTVDITDANVSPNLTTFTGGSNYLLQSSSGYGISNGSLVKSGAGTLTITNTNSYTGGTTIAGGTINVNNAAALGDSSGALTFSGSGGTIQLGATISSSRNYVMNADGTIDTNGYDLAHSGVISGTAGLVKTGAGTLTLAGSSTFSGAFTIGQGTVIAQNNTAFGSSSSGVTVSPGTTLDLGGSMSQDSLNLGTEVFTVSGTGVGGLGAIVNNGSNQQLNAIAKIVLAGPTTFGGTKRWDMRNNSPSLDFGGFTLTKTGSNTVALVGVTGTNAGNIDIQQGTFGVQTSSNLGGSSANTITVRSGATLDMFDTVTAVPWSVVLENGATVYGEHSGASTQNTLSGPVSMLGTGTMNVASGYVMTLSGNVSGAGASIIKTGSGTLTLSGSNTYDGLTTVSTGVLAVQNANALGSTAAGTTVISGGQLEVANGVTISGEAVTLNGGGSVFFGALRSGSGNGIWDGQVTIGDSAVRIGAVAGTTLTVTGSIVNGGGNSIQISGQSGTGVVVLNPTGTNLYSGTTGIIRGILRIGKTDALPTGTVLDVDSASAVSDAATFDMAGFNQTVSALQLSAASNINGLITNSVSGTTSTLTVNQAVNTSFGGVIESGSGTVALVKSGAGSLTLTGSNTYTGGSNINGGKVIISTGGLLANNASNTAAVNNTGTLSFGRNDTFGTSASGNPVTPIVISAGGVVTNEGSFFTTLGPVTLNGGTLTSVGGVSGTFGSFALRGTVTVGGTSASTISPAGTNSNINLGANSITSTTFDVADVVAGADLNVSGVLQNGASASNVPQASSLIKTGSGTMVLAASNTYTGATTISNGTLQIGSGGTTGSLSGSSAITDNAVLVFNRTDTVTQGTNFGTIIGGTGSVIQAGSGTLVLSASNGYSGGTILQSAGAIQLGNSNAAGAGTIYLKSTQSSTGRTLGLTGGINVANPIEIDITTGRENIESLSGGGVNTLSGPITVTGGSNRIIIVQNNSGSAFNVASTVSGAAFSGNLSFRGNTDNSKITSTAVINLPSATVDFNMANAFNNWTIESTGNIWARSALITTSTAKLILGANDALATGARMTWTVTTGTASNGVLSMNGKNQSLAGLEATGFTAGAPKIINDSGSSDSTLTLAGMTADYTYGGAITDGTGGRNISLVMNSAGRTQTLTGSNSYSGGTTITSGTLVAGNASALGASTGSLAVNGGILDLKGNNVTVGLLSGSSGGLITTSSNASSILTAGTTGTSSYGGVIVNTSGTLGLTKVGNGTLTLGGTNAYNGLTTVSAGTLAFDVSETLTGGLNVATSGTAVLTAHSGGASNVKVLDISSLTISGTTPFAGGGTKTAGFFANEIVDSAGYAGTGFASPAPVPEPGTIGLLVVGVIGGAILRRRSRKV